MTDLNEHYTEYQGVLEQADASMSLAECHGLFTGVLSLNAQANVTVCLPYIFDDLFDADDSRHVECLRVLETIFSQTRLDLNGPGVEFTLLLADDEQALLERAFDLQVWAQGYLFGLGLAGLPALTDTNETSGSGQVDDQVREMIQDIIEISHLSLDGLSGSNDNEKDLSDLIEYVRVGVLFIQEECNPLMHSGSIH